VAAYIPTEKCTHRQEEEKKAKCTPHCKHTVPKFETEVKLRGFVPNYYIYVFVSDFYSPDLSAFIFAAAK
jgi:hypothetical protein